MSGLEDLKEFQDLLEEVPSLALTFASRALDAGAEHAREKGIDAITKRYNLPRSYVSDRIKVKQSALTSLESRVSAKTRPVLATRYGAKQATTGAPGSAGDPSRGIPPGQKGAGSTPWAVRRGGGGKAWRNAFFVRLKGSGAWGLVARYGSGEGLSDKQDWKQNLDVVHSLSVDQAWRYVRDEVAPEAMALAQEKFLEQLEDRL
jgi:hypothetical protein